MKKEDFFLLNLKYKKKKNFIFFRLIKFFLVKSQKN